MLGIHLDAQLSPEGQGHLVETGVLMATSSQRPQPTHSHSAAMTHACISECVFIFFEELPDKKTLFLNFSLKEFIDIHPTDNRGCPIKNCRYLKDPLSDPIEML